MTATESRNGAKFFVDVAPLMEIHWTGMATAAANLARYFLQHHPSDTVFFVGHRAVAHAYVSTAVTASPGGYLRSLVGSGAAVAGSLAEALSDGRFSYGMFSSSKPFHRVFDRELIIVHDLSSLLTPELHKEQTVRNHGESLLKDTLSSDLVCCSSQATQQDVLIYLPVAREKTFVAPLASDWVRPARRDPARRASPYVVILGTIEPRKNLKLIAGLLARHKALCSQFTFYFIGAPGWGTGLDTVFADLLADEEVRRSLVFTGYMPEQEKRSLVAGATCAIYPSLFEGFGLPAVECMSVGCPVLTGRTSSLMELGIPPEFQFDPFSVTELYDSLRALLRLSDSQLDALSESLIETSRTFSWTSFGDRIVAALLASDNGASRDRHDVNRA
jgi:glycosyltransferase involved in cell wall biosynthesis